MKINQNLWRPMKNYDILWKNIGIYGNLRKSAEASGLLACRCTHSFKPSKPPNPPDKLQGEGLPSSYPLPDGPARSGDRTPGMLFPPFTLQKVMVKPILCQHVRFSAPSNPPSYTHHTCYLTSSGSAIRFPTAFFMIFLKMCSPLEFETQFLV